MTDQSERYHKEIIVEASHIDALGHVNNMVYLEWVLMMAGEHWFQTAPEEDKSQFRWVVRRHELDYLKPAFEGDKLIATTWVEEMGGVQSIRRVDLEREGVKVLSARTVWILIDAESGRLSRVPDRLTALYFQ